MKKTAPFALCVWGAVLPYSQLILWLTAHDLNARLFLLLANRIRTFFAPVVLLRFFRAESSRFRIPHASAGYPGHLSSASLTWAFLFLYLGEVQLQRSAAPGQLVN